MVAGELEAGRLEPGVGSVLIMTGVLGRAVAGCSKGMEAPERGEKEARGGADWVAGCSGDRKQSRSPSGPPFWA